MANKRRAGRPTKEMAKAKQRAIVDAAFEQFVQTGFRGATMRDIAARAEISTRTLYNHYPDKLAVFDACVEQTAGEFDRIDAGLEMDLRSWLIRYTLEMHDQLMCERSRQITLLIFREGNDFDGLREVARNRFEELQVAPVVERLASEAVSIDASRYLATQFVTLALAEWQRQLIFGAQEMSNEALRDNAERVTSLFLDGAMAFSQNWDRVGSNLDSLALNAPDFSR